MKLIAETNLIDNKELLNVTESQTNKNVLSPVKKLHNYKLLNLKLIKSKILKKKHYLKNIGIKDINCRLRKALRIIYLFHASKKRITFVGNPLNINKKISKLLQETGHKFLPTSAWMAGIITNRYNSLKWMFKKEKNILTKISQRLLNFKKRSDLVVILDKNLNFVALDESYKSKIPIISLNNSLNPFDLGSDYKVPGDFLVSKGDIKNNLFYAVLVSIFKQATQTKFKFPRFFRKRLSTLDAIKKSESINKKYSDIKKKRKRSLKNNNNAGLHAPKASYVEQEKIDWEELTLSQQRKIIRWIKVKKRRMQLRQRVSYGINSAIRGSKQKKVSGVLKKFTGKKTPYEQKHLEGSGEPLEDISLGESMACDDVVTGKSEDSDK